MSTETRIERFGPADFDALTDLWEASVRATHTFLLQGEVERLRPMVRNACLESADIYGMRGQDGRPVAFSGVCGDGNTGAAVFYRRMGFAEISRDETDSQGMPYPVLHMELVRR